MLINICICICSETPVNALGGDNDGLHCECGTVIRTIDTEVHDTHILTTIIRIIHNSCVVLFYVVKIHTRMTTVFSLIVHEKCSAAWRET